MCARFFSLSSLFLMLGVLGEPAVAGDKQEVIWGGLAMSSHGRSAMAPVAETLLKCSEPSATGSCPIEDLAKKMVLDAKFEKISVKNTYAEDRVSYLISAVIDAEMVSSVVLGEGEERYVYQFLILGSLVVYEVTPQETLLLSSVPISVYADRYFRNKLSQEQKEAVIRSMYLELEAYNGQPGYYNFFSNLIGAAEPVLDRPLKFGSGVQFTKVSFSDVAVEALSRVNDLDTLSNVFAAWATANLAEATGQPIIPSTLGANDLKLVFRDAEMTITLPEALYEFDMHVQALDTYKNSSYTCFDVAAYYGVRVFDDLILDAPIQHGADSCAFLEDGTAVSAEIYPANLLAQIQQVMFGFSPQKDDWEYIKSHTVQDRETVLNGFKKVREDVFNGN